MQFKVNDYVRHKEDDYPGESHLMVVVASSGRFWSSAIIVYYLSDPLRKEHNLINHDLRKVNALDMMEFICTT